METRNSKDGARCILCSPSAALLARCVQDTALTVDVIRQCQPLLPARAWLLERQLAPYLVQQQANGVHFDMEKAQSLVAKLRQKQHLLHQAAITWGGTWTQESGKPFVPKRTNAKLGYVSGIPVQKYKTVEFNPNSRAHIIKRLKETYGWEPTVFTEANNPKLDEAVLAPLAQATLPDGTPQVPCGTDAAGLVRDGEATRVPVRLPWDTLDESGPAGLYWAGIRYTWSRSPNGDLVWQSEPF